MAVAARDYGLIPFDAVDEIGQMDCRSGCQCAIAAHQILDRHLSTQNNGKALPRVDIGKVKAAFDQETQTYKKKLDSPERNSQNNPKSNSCERLAPVMFDFLLQQLRRYS